MSDNYYIMLSKRLFSTTIIASLVASTFTAAGAFALEPSIDELPIATDTTLSNVASDEYVIVTTEGKNDSLLENMSSYQELMNVEGNTTALLTKAEAEQVVYNIPDAEIIVDQKILLDNTITQSPAPSWGVDRIDSPTYVSDNTYKYNSDGTGVKVYVIDSGINPHNDYNSKLLAGYTTINDGLGTADCDGHGTFVAGLVAGTTYGVAKDASLVPVRIFDCEGASYSTDLIDGLNWIINNHSGGKGIINMSLGGDANTAVDNAVQAAIDAGFIVITSAGNGGADSIGDDACTLSPARVSGAFTVAASNTSNLITDWSNIGSCVDIVAPGENVISTINTSATATAIASGTSFSAPIVAGIAARYWELNSTFSNNQITDLMSSASVQGIISNASTKNTVNKLAYITSEPVVSNTVPSAPQNLSTSNISDDQLDVSWTAPANNGGATITDYVIKYSDNNGQTWTTFTDGENTNTSVTVTGLISDTDYVISVAAVNSVGTGSEATVNVSTLVPTLPSAVTNIQVPTNVYGTLRLSWTAPVSSGSKPITDYVITFSRDNGATWTTFNDGVSTDTSFTMKFPATGVFYQFRIQAKTDVGLGTAAGTSVRTIALAKPSAPRSFALKSNLVNRINLQWLAPLQPGSSPVTDYIISYTTDGRSWTIYNDGVSSSTNASVVGLQSGTRYTFMVKARNSIGISSGTTIVVTSR